MCRGNIWYVLILIIIPKFSLVRSWSSIEKHVDHPDHPGKCFNAEYHLHLKLGQTVGGFEKNDDRFCQKMTCEVNEFGELQIKHIGCEVVSRERGCVKVKGHKSLPYPLCCPHLKCNKRVKTTIDDDADPVINWANEYCQYCKYN